MIEGKRILLMLVEDNKGEQHVVEVREPAIATTEEWLEWWDTHISNPQIPHSSTSHDDAQ